MTNHKGSPRNTFLLLHLLSKKAKQKRPLKSCKNGTRIGRDTREEENGIESSFQQKSTWQPKQKATLMLICGTLMYTNFTTLDGIWPNTQTSNSHSKKESKSPQG